MGAEVYIAGVGMTKFGKSNQPLPELVVEAALKAFSDARVNSIDYVLIGVMNTMQKNSRGRAISLP